MMTRRTLLAGAVSAAQAAGARTPRVFAHIWVFAARQPNYDATPILDQVFRECKEGGVDGVEVMDRIMLHDDCVARLRRLVKEYGLPLAGSSWGASMWDAGAKERILKEGDAVTGRLADAGGRTLGISVGDARRRKTPAEFDTQAEVLRAVFRMCSARGIVPNLHNHVYEVAGGEFDLRNTLERVPEARLGPDLNWVKRAGIDPVDFVRRHGSRMVYAHLRDEKADGKWPEAMGEGVMDYGAIAAAMKAAGFTGDVAIELAHERDFTPTRSYGASFKISREYVRRVMGW